MASLRLLAVACVVLACIAIVVPAHARVGGLAAADTAPASTAIPTRYGWTPISKVGVPATAAAGGTYGHDSYHVCRVKDGSAGAVGKIVDTLGVTACTYADPGSPSKDTTTLHDFDVLVSANLGAWQSTPPAPGQGVAVPVTTGSSTLVGRAIEDSSDTVPVRCAGASRAARVC